MAIFKCTLGAVEICETDGAISVIRPSDLAQSDLAPSEEATTLERAALAQIEQYLAGKRRCFDIPIATRGTDFQREVWDAIRAIPYGETRSYGEIARAIGRSSAARAVGAAAGGNSLWIVVPCHRVVGADGALTGYAWGVELKHRLLALEGAIV